jgi:hypothetical protein
VFKGLARRVVAISSGDVYRAYDRFRRADPGSPDPTPLMEASPLRDRLFPYRDKAHGPDDFLFNYEKIFEDIGKAIALCVINHRAAGRM